MHPDIDILLRYADGELSPADGRKLQKHLESCGECRLEARRLQYSTMPVGSAPAPATDVLDGIRQWNARRPKTDNSDLKQRVAAEIGAYLGTSGSTSLLSRVGDGQELLPGLERVLSDFIGRRAVGHLVDRIVEHAIMRT